MANGKRGRPMTAVSAKLANLLADVAYIQEQLVKDSRVTADQRTALDSKLQVIGANIQDAQSVFAVPVAVVDNTASVTADSTQTLGETVAQAA